MVNIILCSMYIYVTMYRLPLQGVTGRRQHAMCQTRLCAIVFTVLLVC